MQFVFIYFLFHKISFFTIYYAGNVDPLGTTDRQPRDVKRRAAVEEEDGDPISDKSRFCMYTSGEYKSAGRSKGTSSCISSLVLEARGQTSISRDAFFLIRSASYQGAETRDRQLLID